MLLIENDELISFCIYAEKDDINLPNFHRGYGSFIQIQYIEGIDILVDYLLK